MPNQRTHVPVVRQWCQSLGVLSAVSISRHEADMKLAAYVPLLVDRFPDAAFTKASLDFCAFRAAKGFPTYSELGAWLHEWWRDHRPAPLRVAGPNASLSAERERETAALAADWDDVAGIRRRIAALGDDPRSLRLLCALVNRHAPQHLGWFPPALIEALRQDVPPPPLAPERQVPAGYLTPAHLDQINPLPGRTRDGSAAATHDRNATPSTAAVDPDTFPQRDDADAIPF